MTQDEKIALVHGYSDQPTPIATSIEDGHTYSFATGTTSTAMPGSMVNLGSCLDVPGAGSNGGLLLQQWGACGNSGAELFTARSAGAGAFSLVNVGADKCLSVVGGGTSNGTRLEIRDCTGGSEQVFAFGPLSAGGTTIVNPRSGRCVDVAANDPRNGTAIDIYDCYQPNKAQQWFAYEGLNAGNVPANARLGIPALRLEDGPAGVGEQLGRVTEFPAPLLIAATWDTSIARVFGAAVGMEHARKGDNVVLGPSTNILRVPQDGRAFEGLGEDPFLAAQMASALVGGVQSQGVIATIKHLIDNDQETSRGYTNAIIDDRTQHEIELPPFAAAVSAGVGAAMCSYNMVNGIYACENDHVQNELLKNELGFHGFIMSDWGATHSTTRAALGGLDLEMPNSQYFGSELASAIAAGLVPQRRLDDMVTRILTSMFDAGIFDRAAVGSLAADVTSVDHKAFARSASAQGTVLLKNDRALLPIDSSRVHTIAVLGDAADIAPVTVGGGSAWVRPSDLVTPLQGIKARASGISVRYEASSGTAAATTAAAADLAIVVVGTWSGEGSDRPDLSLPRGSDDLVSAIVAANPNTVVVVYAPAQVVMPWAGAVPSILFGFLPGQEQGNALADVLFGVTNPSAKLPMTIASSPSDYPVSSAIQYPGKDLGSISGNEWYEAHYTEGFLIGYRYFDSAAIAPLFPFGHGLSYTTFEYENLAMSSRSIGAADTVTVSCDVANRGNVAGAEVVQLYIGLPVETSEPPRQLVAFQKVQLAPHETSHVTFSLHPRSYSFWSAGLGSWVPYAGTHKAMIGSSSRDIRLSGTFDVTGGPLAGDGTPAESGTLHGGAAVETGQKGFTGAGFVGGFTAEGAKVSFTVNARAAGSHRAIVRYGATQAAASLTLYVNDAKIAQRTFPALANLDTWDFETSVVDLATGANTIAYEYDHGDTGGVNIDAFILGEIAQASDAGADATAFGGADLDASRAPCETGECATFDAGGGAGCSCRSAPPCGHAFAWALLPIAGFAVRRGRLRREDVSDSSRRHEGERGT